MAKFLAIGYGDRAGYEWMDAQVRDATHGHDAHLRGKGVDQLELPVRRPTDMGAALLK